MITRLVALALAWEIHDTPWESECLRLGLDPSSATADQVIGPIPRDGMWDAIGKRVLPYQDAQYQDTIEEAPEQVPQDPRAFVKEVAQVAGLTRSEARLVYAIVDGSPVPDGKNYTEPLARRFRTTPAAVRTMWRRAKDKLRLNWAAE